MYATSLRYSKLCVVCTGLLILALLGAWWNKTLHQSAEDYFARALREGGVSEMVVVEGQRYQVERGVSTNLSPHAAQADTWLVLKTAYEKAVARRTPLLGIAGTDPAKLSAAVEELASGMDTLKDIQKTAAERASLSALYPLQFLHSLSLLEAARLQFLASGSSNDALRYDAALHGALSAGDSDLRSFTRAFSGVLSGESPDARFVTFGGTMTVDSFRQSLGALQKRFQEVERTLEQRERCFSGMVVSCDATALELPIPNPVPSFVEAPGSAALRADVKSLLWEGGPSPSSFNRPEVALATSVCIGRATGPSYFLLNTQQPFRAPQYIDDLFFSTSTTATGTVSGYIVAQYEVPFTLSPPTVFYQCPETWRDEGLMYALVDADSLLRTHEELVDGELPPSGTPIREDRTVSLFRRAFMKEPAGDSASQTTLNDFIDVGLEFRERSARLEYAVEQVASIVRTDVAHFKAGVPFDLSARTLFLSHSAFASLFLSQNDDAGTTALGLREPYAAEERNVLRLWHFRYSIARERVPRATFVRSINAVRAFESAP